MAAYYGWWSTKGVDQRIERLIALLREEGGETIGTSVRLPASVREAVGIANELGLAETTTELTVRGLREALEAFAQRALLDAHYRAHPHVRPELAEIARAAAELDGSPLAERPELVRRAAREVAAIKDDPSPEDVLLYAAGLAAAA